MRKIISILILISYIIAFLILYLVSFIFYSSYNLAIVLAILLIVNLSVFCILQYFIFKNLPGYIFGFLTFTIGFLGDLLALFFSPEYIIWRHSISWLGQLTGGLFLRIGLIISNTLAISFMFYLGRVLKDENVSENARKLAISAGITTSVSAVLTGTFSGIPGIISDLHGFFALVSWIGGAIVCLIFGYIMVRNSKFTKNISNVGYAIGGIFVVYLIPFFITNFCNYFQAICFSFGRMVYSIMPIFEWILILSILTWYLANSIYLFKNKI